MASILKRTNGSSVQLEDEWDPFGALTTVRKTMNSLLDNAMLPQTGSDGGAVFAPALDLYEKDGTYIIECMLPGYKKEDINIELHDNRLTISGKQEREHADDTKRYHYREMRRGSFARTVALPYDLESDKVTAEYRDGILKVMLPAPKQAQAKNISINS